MHSQRGSVVKKGRKRGDIMRDVTSQEKCRRDPWDVRKRKEEEEGGESGNLSFEEGG